MEHYFTNVAYGVCALAFGQALVTELRRATGSLLRRGLDGQAEVCYYLFISNKKARLT